MRPFLTRSSRSPRSSAGPTTVSAAGAVTDGRAADAGAAGTGARASAAGRLDVALRRLRPAAEQEFLHLAGQELAGLGLEEHEPVLVDQHGLVSEPLLPGLLRDLVVNALAELTRIRRAIETFRLAAEQYALDHSCHCRTPDRRLGHRQSRLRSVSTPAPPARWPGARHTYTRRSRAPPRVHGRAAASGSRARWRDRNA